MITYSGQIRFGLFSSVPFGWLACTGQSVTSTQYPNLAAAWGKSGTFSLPNFGGSAPVGPGGAVSSTIGAEGGSATSSQLVNHVHVAGSHSHSIPSHSHSGTTVSGVSSANVTTGTQGTTGWRAFSGTGGVGSGGGGNTGSAGGNTGATGSGTSFSLMQPYVVCRAIVKI